VKDCKFVLLMCIVLSTADDWSSNSSEVPTAHEHVGSRLGSAQDCRTTDSVTSH